MPASANGHNTEKHRAEGIDTLYHGKTLKEWGLAKYQSDIDEQKRVAFLGIAIKSLDKMERLKYRQQPKGESHYKAKLTAADVKKIRELKQKGLRNSFIAGMFGVNTAAVSDLLRGDTWKHIK